jgi:hypothetical protein
VLLSRRCTVPPTPFVRIARRRLAAAAAAVALTTEKPVECVGHRLRALTSITDVCTSDLPGARLTNVPTGVALSVRLSVRPSNLLHPFSYPSVIGSSRCFYSLLSAPMPRSVTVARASRCRHTTTANLIVVLRRGVFVIKFLAATCGGSDSSSSGGDASSLALAATRAAHTRRRQSRGCKAEARRPTNQLNAPPQLVAPRSRRRP